VGIVPSIEMVIFTAVGGKLSLYGAVYGALLVNTGKSLFSENFPQLWLFMMGGLFIAVVVLFPNGIAGIWQNLTNQASRWVAARRKAPALAPTPAPAAEVIVPATLETETSTTP
jgi:urea transport system permease protein